MRSRETFLEALRALRDHEEVAEHGWVLLGMLRPDHHKAVESAAGQGLVELADRRMHAELSVYVCRPFVRAARFTGHGPDVLTYARPAPSLATSLRGPLTGERLVELRRSEMDALRVVRAPRCPAACAAVGRTWRSGRAQRDSSAPCGPCT
jgi:hypothetical protein